MYLYVPEKSFHQGTLPFSRATDNPHLPAKFGIESDTLQHEALPIRHLYTLKPDGAFLRPGCRWIIGSPKEAIRGQLYVYYCSCVVRSEPTGTKNNSSKTQTMAWI